jgi:type IV pilus assembly protein PilC
MAQFRYRALNKDGKVIAGTYTCLTAREVELMLEKLNLSVLSCQEYRPLLGMVRKKAIGRRDLINFCFYLEQMTRSGISLIDALTDLQLSLAPSYLSEVISIIVAEIKEGRSFSETLGGFPDIFSSSFISLINAGEKSGELNHVLKDLAESLRWQDELISQTKKALTLPAFIGVVVFAVVFFLMTYLVPQMLKFITSMTAVGHQLPLYTQLLIAVSDFFVAYWYLILITPVVVMLVFKQALKHNPAFKLMFDRYKLKFWLFGPILEKIILARFANYLALLYNAGLPLIESLKITEAIVANSAVEQELQIIRKMIAEGAGIGLAFEMRQMFPHLVLSMLKMGEKTGDLGNALKNVSYFYKRDVDDAIENIQSLIEPAMTLILGVIIGWVMMSVLGPIYDLISTIKI